MDSTPTMVPGAPNAKAGWCGQAPYHSHQASLLTLASFQWTHPPPLRVFGLRAEKVQLFVSCFWCFLRVGCYLFVFSDLKWKRRLEGIKATKQTSELRWAWGGAGRKTRLPSSMQMFLFTTGKNETGNKINVPKQFSLYHLTEEGAKWMNAEWEREEMISHNRSSLSTTPALIGIKLLCWRTKANYGRQENLQSSEKASNSCHNLPFLPRSSGTAKTICVWK